WVGGGCDQDGAGAPFLEVVSTRARLKGIIIFTYMSRYNPLQLPIRPRDKLHGFFPYVIDVLSFIIGGRQHRNSGRFSSPFCIVVDLLIMEIKTEGWLKFLSCGF